MKIKITCFLLIIVCVCQTFAQKTININQGFTETKEYYSTIPYRNVNGKLIIDVFINNKQYNFLLDTGAPTSISKEVYETVVATNMDVVELTDSSGLKDSIQVVMVPQIGIDHINFINTPAFVFDESANRFFKCLAIDGIIGSNLLRNSTIQFDALHQQVILTDSSKKLNLKKRDAYELKLNEIQSNPFIKSKIVKDNYTGSDYVLFDSGDNSFYSIAHTAYKELAAQIDIFETVAETTGAYSVGLYGMEDQNEHLLLKVPTLALGSMEFKNVVLITTYGATSRVGAKFLDYGKATLDYKKGRFWFETYTKATVVLDEKIWSIQPVLNNENEMVVGVIWDKTLEDKINVGDKILKFDTIDYTHMDYCEIMNSGTQSDKLVAVLVYQDKDTKEIKQLEVGRLNY